MMRRPLLVLALLLGAVLLPPGAARAADLLHPVGPVPIVPLGRAATPYLVVGARPVQIPIQGPGTVTLYARVAMPDQSPSRQSTSDQTKSRAAATPRSGVLQVEGLPGQPLALDLEFRPSRSATWPDDRAGRPSAGTRASLEIPAGRHDLRLSAVLPGNEEMLVVLYFDGPAQPRVPGLQAPAPTPPSAVKKKAKKKSPWSFRQSAGLDIMYNDNILTNSPDDLDSFQLGLEPYKFKHHSDDDLVLAPSVDLEARRKFLDWGLTRFRFKFKHWLYTHNPIKTNTDFHFYGRQDLGKKSSLEAYFHFAPEQYIGLLSDRSPLDDPDGDLQYPEFTFQRNVWSLTWRQKLSRSLSARLLYEENYRYYNQEHQENDIEAWEVRGNLAWKMNRTFTWNVDYSYEDGNGKGLDEVGEDILTSDNSDPSYERDLYRLGLTVNPRPWRRVLQRIDLSFLFMDYYYTTTKSLVEDPYHAGRRDTYYKATVEVRRKLTKTLTLKLATRRTQRIVYSPWEGDITTDKDFVQWLYWINLDLRF